MLKMLKIIRILWESTYYVLPFFFFFWLRRFSPLLSLEISFLAARPYSLPLPLFLSPFLPLVFTCDGRRREGLYGRQNRKKSSSLLSSLSLSLLFRKLPFPSLTHKSGKIWRKKRKIPPSPPTNCFSKTLIKGGWAAKESFLFLSYLC